MKRHTLVCILLALAASPALALINPNFTPVHLVGQSDLILELQLGPVAAGAAAIPVKVVACAKGEAPKKPPVLDLSRTAKPQAEALLRLIGAAEPQLAVLFSGKFRDEGPDAGGQEPEEGTVGLLHVGGRWFRLFSKDPGVWLVDVVDEHMQGCWAGGTDMLFRETQYVLTDPDPTVPVRTGASWADQKKIAAVQGKVHGAMAVDLAGDGRLALHILAEAGDRLLQWDKGKKAFADLAPALKLGAKSRCAAWADLDGDGRLDLASWDGQALALWLQTADGTFAATDPKVALKECLGLAPLGLDAKGRTGLVVSTASYPMLLTPGEGGSLKSGYLIQPAAGKFLGAGLGQARPCLVADLDGDNAPDVLQPFEKGILFYKGQGGGAFEAPTLSDSVGTGPGEAGAYLGDFDADGLLDVFVGADDRCMLWQNRGGGKFEDALGLSGEAAYISKPSAFGGNTCDVNNDGRQDVFILYSNRPPHIFFNRGFRSFGHSHMLDLAEHQLLPAAEDGEQAGLVADLDGDGGQDMALVLKNGEVWVCFRDVADAAALCVRAELPLGGAYAGPLTVTGWRDKRCLGAWSVAAGGPGAFLGLIEPGPCRVRWQFPGAKPQEKEIVVEEKPVRLLLTP